MSQIRRPLFWGWVVGLALAAWTVLPGIQFIDRVGSFKLSWQPVDELDRLVLIAGDIVQVFAILGGITAQVIAVVLAVFNPSSKNISNIEEISVRLEKLQGKLLALVGVYGLTLICALGAKVMAGSSSSGPKIEGFTGAALAAGAITFVLVSVMRTIELAPMILDLQRLKSQTILEDARARQEDVQRAGPQMDATVADPSPSAYGKSVTTVNPNKKRAGRRS